MRHYSRTEMEQVFDHVLGKRMLGVGPQGMHEVSTVQRYEIGARMQLGSRVFHYAQAGGVIVPDHGAWVANEQDVPFRAIGAAAVAGARQIVVTIAANDGPAYDGSMPLNWLKGGTVVVFVDGALRAFTRGILGNTLVAAPGGDMTLTLDAPIPEALDAADDAECIASPYRLVVDQGDTHLGGGFSLLAGIASLPTVLNDYLWIQTWGPCWQTIAADVGEAIDRKLVIVNQHGLGFVGGDHAAYLNIGQVAGVVMGNSAAGTQGAPFVNLMLDP